MNKRLFVFLGAVGLLWLATVMTSFGEPQHVVPKGSEQSAATPSLGAEPTVPKEAPSTPVAPAEVITAVKSAPVRLMPGSPEALSLERQSFTRYFNSLDTKRASEPKDAIWANTVRYDVEQAMKKPEFLGTKIESIDCGSTLCRIEAEHKDGPAKRRFSDQFHLEIGETLPEATMYVDPETKKTVAHFARAGFELPRIPIEELEALAGMRSAP